MSYFLGQAYGHVGLIDRAFHYYEKFRQLGFADHPDLNNAMGKLVMTTGEVIEQMDQLFVRSIVRSTDWLIDWLIVLCLYLDPHKSLGFMDAARLFCPARLNEVDSYSHLLFILDDHVRMRTLADDIVGSGRFTAECSIAMGNSFGWAKHVQSINQPIDWSNQPWLFCLILSQGYSQVFRYFKVISTVYWETTRRPCRISSKLSATIPTCITCGPWSDTSKLSWNKRKTPWNHTPTQLVGRFFSIFLPLFAIKFHSISKKI